MRPTLLLVDDHAGFRRSARAFLHAEGFDVVGAAAAGADALERAAELRPQIVLLDIQLPDLDGFEVAERMAAVSSPPSVILISSRDAPDFGERLASARVRGFIAKRDLSGSAIRALIE